MIEKKLGFGLNILFLNMATMADGGGHEGWIRWKEQVLMEVVTRSPLWRSNGWNAKNKTGQGSLIGS